MSMQQRLSMFLGRNPNVAQFFELYKQSVSKEISLHKNLFRPLGKFCLI